MDPLQNITAFVRVARLGSFSAAARELDLAPSVVTKRITQLEKSLDTRLVVRSTRGLALTATGDRFLPRFVRLLAEFDEIFGSRPGERPRLEGHLRIKSPTVIATEFLGVVLAEFQVEHPGVSLDLVLMDRSANPLEESFDLALGALPVSYPDVIDVPMCQYELVTCCAPAYLNGKPPPQYPTELIDYECLTTTLFRSNWIFESSRGALSVEVHSRMNASESRVLREATLKGLGIAILPRFLADAPLQSGALIALFPDFPVATFWLKALVPRMKMNKPVIRELVAHLKKRLQELTHATPA